jgi:hypothetical protein
MGAGQWQTGIFPFWRSYVNGTVCACRLHTEIAALSKTSLQTSEPPLEQPRFDRADYPARRVFDALFLSKTNRAEAAMQSTIYAPQSLK